MIGKDRLIEFEAQVAELYDAGKIKAPIHLSGGNEDQLIEIFKSVKPNDWVLSTWRSHYHALLKGIPEEEVMRQIFTGKSMHINSVEHKFYASSIVGGICPIAVGLAMAIKRKRLKAQVWCFVGDMAAMSGIFYECRRYAEGFDLPIMFIIEDNGISVKTSTAQAWSKHTIGSIPPIVEYYRYDLKWPHHGTGKWVNF